MQTVQTLTRLPRDMVLRFIPHATETQIRLAQGNFRVFLLSPGPYRGQNLFLAAAAIALAEEKRRLGMTPEIVAIAKTYERLINSTLTHHHNRKHEQQSIINASRRRSL